MKHQNELSNTIELIDYAIDLLSEYGQEQHSKATILRMNKVVHSVLVKSKLKAEEGSVFNCDYKEAG